MVQTNLAASNWVYGSLSEQDLKKSVFDQMTQNLSILKCSQEVPFFNGQRCISCPGDTVVFNLSTKSC